MAETNQEPWPSENIDRILDLLPILESPGFLPATWPKLDDTVVDGVRVIQMPYPEYHEAMDTLRRLIWEGPTLNPYDPLPEDKPDTDPRKPDFETSTSNQIRRYLMLCCRDERFSDGYLESQFLSGSIPRALERLRVLRQRASK